MTARNIWLFEASKPPAILLKVGSPQFQLPISRLTRNRFTIFQSQDKLALYSYN